MIVHECDQGGDQWIALRAGKPTASCFDKIITSTGDPSKSQAGYAITLAGELYAGKPLDSWDGNSYTERGKLLEDEARKMYAFINDVEPVQVGFVTDDDQSYGCSPDSLVGDDGLLEIKCLKAENHIKAILYYRKNKKCPPDYIQQTQGQMMICQRSWCDLFFYHPDLPKLVIRQNSDEKLFNALKDNMTKLLAIRDEIYLELKAA